MPRPQHSACVLDFDAAVLAQDLSPVAKLAANDYLTNASTFHSLHAISRQVRAGFRLTARPLAIFAAPPRPL